MVASLRPEQTKSNIAPLHVLPGVGVQLAKIRVQIVYIIICGHICSVATTSEYLIALTSVFGILTAPHAWEGG